jgi:nicotinamide-nucleotide amidase
MSEALVARALSLLRQRGLTLAVAEGSSGGTLSHLITEVPGCSDVFLGGGRGVP